VVESLTEAMQIPALRIASLTLEPIAAMTCYSPGASASESCFVDVGQVLPICYLDAGSVAAYAMATVAGDEITEAVARNIL
jgi:cell division ATPase FtsA